MSNDEKIIKALRSGSVPSYNIKDICVGREDEINELERILANIKKGDSDFKFILGNYGMGKSFFLKYAEQISFDDNFVVSTVVIGHEIPFHKLNLVYSQIVRNLRCKTGITLKHIIDRWLNKLEKRAKQVCDLEKDQEKYILSNIEKTVDEIRIYSNNFAELILNYYKNKNTDLETANYIIAWLSGDQHVPAIRLRKFGVKGRLTDNDVFDFIKALSLFLTRINYSGLVILFDEIENIAEIAQERSRKDAFDYMRKFVDFCANNEMKYNLFLFACTNHFLNNDKKGISSYEALHDRIISTRDDMYFNMRKPIIKLKGFDKDNFYEITTKIQEYHDKAFNWDSNLYLKDVKDDFINHLYDEESFGGGLINPRDYNKQIVDCLDIIQQNPEEFKNSENVLNLFKDIRTSEDKKVKDDW